MADTLRRRRRLHLHPRELRVNAGPTRRAGCPDGHRGAGEIRIIKSSDPHEDQVGSCLGLAEDRGTASDAESTVHSIAAVRDAREVASLSRNLEHRRAKAGANRSTACTQVLAVPTPAHARTIGGSRLSQRTAPQRHFPVTVIARSSLNGGEGLILPSAPQVRAHHDRRTVAARFMESTSTTLIHGCKTPFKYAVSMGRTLGRSSTERGGCQCGAVRYHDGISALASGSSGACVPGLRFL